MQCYILALHMKYFFKMQVFHRRWKPDGVSLGIKIHPPINLNGLHLLAVDLIRWIINDFGKFLAIVHFHYLLPPSCESSQLPCSQSYFMTSNTTPELAYWDIPSILSSSVFLILMITRIQSPNCTTVPTWN